MTPRSFSRLWLVIVSLLSFAVDGTAQTTVEGRVTIDKAIIWRSEVAAPFATVPAGTALEVTAQSGRWYEVVIPESLGGRGERGLIARSQLRIVGDATAIPTRALRGEQLPGASTTPRADAPRQTAPAASETRKPRREPVRGLVFVDGVFQMASADFANTLSFQENAELAQLESISTLKSIRGFSGGAAAMWPSGFGLGASVERSTTATPTALSGTIPHPFFFGAGRSISGDIDGLEREELALHIEFRMTWSVGRRLQVSALGGPSVFHVTQGIVSGVRYDDSYPYDAARFTGADSVTATKDGLGFNAGGEAMYFFNRVVGIGARLTMSRATIKLPMDDGSEASVEAGGLRTGVGLRLRF